MLVVVHHGGAGTTHTGLRAGVPNLAVPFGADQAFWGNRIAAIGAGPPPIPRRTLTTDRLASAIHTMATNDSLRGRGAIIAKRRAEERGVDQAVTIIDRTLAGRARPEAPYGP